MKAPFRVIFSNDTTNILTCTSPYHRKGEPFRAEMLESTVDETAGTGVDAHFIQLAHGWVPWYQSRVYPIAEHVRWWKARYGVDPTGGCGEIATCLRYLLDGGDMLQVFDLSEPYPNPYSPLLGTPETLRAWFVPRNRLRPGANPFRVEMTGGRGKLQLMFIDLAVR